MEMTMSVPDSRVVSFLIHVMLGVCIPDTSQYSSAVSGDITTTSAGNTSNTGAAIIMHRTRVDPLK